MAAVDRRRARELRSGGRAVSRLSAPEPRALDTERQSRPQPGARPRRLRRGGATRAPGRDSDARVREPAGLPHVLATRATAGCADPVLLARGAPADARGGLARP